MLPRRCLPGGQRLPGGKEDAGIRRVAQEETHFPSVEREMVRKGKIVTVTSSRARERERRGTRRERAHLDEGEQLFPVAGIPLFARARPSVLAQERNGRKRLPRGCVDHRGLLRKE